MTWTVLAVLLFWAVGAYNRLMRLRAEAFTAFGGLHAEMSRQVELVREHLPGEPAGGEPHTAWSALQAAAKQFAATLSAARSRPLDAEGIAALAAAQDVLAMAWERAEREDAHDLRGPQLPESVWPRRTQLALQAHAATAQFNEAVSRYNEAIAQFPAVLLAWVFGFKPAGVLAHAPHPALG